MIHLPKYLAVLYVIYLRKKYKKLTIKWRYEQSNSHLAILRLIQSKIYYYRTQLAYNGMYYPSPLGNTSQDKFMKTIFPPKDYEELEILVWHNPEAVCYYLNKINQTTDIHDKITDQLIKWNENY